MQIINLPEVISLSEKVAYLYNKLYDCPNLYTYKNIELITFLEDYDDGCGIRIISRACLRDHTTDQYNLIVDIEGQPIDALRKMHNLLQEQVKEQLPGEYKKILMLN
jgi:hypothetical protein